MAYGDKLWVRVRSTGDFRFETKPEDEIEEVGILYNGSIELSMDDLHDALELDTRGIMVRRFEGHQWYVDAGADSAALDYVVNVAATVTVLGLSGTVAYVKSKVHGMRESDAERRAATLTNVDFETVARQTVQSKFGVPDDKIRIEFVEWSTDGKGTVEFNLLDDGRRFTVDLELQRQDPFLSNQTGQPRLPLGQSSTELASGSTVTVIAPDLQARLNRLRRR